MKKLIVTEFYTLNGVMEAPNEWSFPYWNDDIAKFKFDELMAADTQLLGRVTYEGFAQAWPSMTDEQGFADKMNGMPKYVVSKTLKTAEWNNTTILTGGLADEVRKLKAMPGDGSILVAGSAALVQGLLKEGLADQVQLLVYPISVGHGKTLFGAVDAPLKLVESRTIGGTGVVLSVYTPDGEKK